MKTLNAKSLLAAECGSATTTAVLIERTDQGYRVVATGQTPSTHPAPWHDITLGVQEAVRHIEKIVGRTLLTPGGWPITPQSAARQGVDAFVIVVSAAPPLKLLLTGLTQDFSLMSARRAATSTYAHVVDTLSLDANNSSPETHLQTIHTYQPDVILMTGGIDDGAAQPIIDMAQIIAMALQTANLDEPPTVIYAGNKQLRPQMADILGPISALTSVSNVRPLLDHETIHAARNELEKLYVQKKVMAIPGFDKLKNWSQYPVDPTSKALEKLITFLGQHHGLNVVGATVGSRSTVVCTFSKGQANTTIRSDAGLGQSMTWLLEAISVEQIHRWLPFRISKEALHHQLLNKSLYVNTIPTSPEDLMIEHAVAREILRLVMQQSQEGRPERQWNLVLGGGKPLTGAPHAAHAAMVLLDGLEPWGVTTLALDRSGMLNMLGAVAAVEPAAAVQLTEQDTFLNLGTVIAPVGQGYPGKTAVKVKITFSDGTVKERDVAYGALDLVELPAGAKAKVEIRPARQFDIGLGQAGRGAIAEVEGGLLGIIIDARGRPVKLPAEEDDRLAAVQQWLKELKVSYAPPVNYH